MSAPSYNLIPSHPGRNFADITPLLKLGEGEKNPSSSLTDAIKERFTHFLNLENETWKEMFSAGEETAHFMAGRQFLMPNPWKQGGWIPYKLRSPNEVERRALSLMQYHTSGNLEKWENSNPDVIVTAGVESDEAHEAAEGAKVVVDHYEKRFFYPRVTQEECLQGLTFGSYIWRLRYDAGLKSVTAYRQIFQNKEVKIGPGYGMCGDCGFEGGEEDFTQIEGGVYLCNKCHSEALVTPAARETLDVEAGREPVELGDFRLTLEKFTNCRWDLRCHADESPWLIIRRRTTMAAVRQILGNVKLPDGSGSESDQGLNAADRLAYGGQATAGHGRGSERKTLYKEPATIEEFWMSPDEYGDIRLTKATQTVDGGEIPTGVSLGEFFKGRNICVLGLNDMSEVLGVYVEDHRNYIVQGKWYAKTGTGAGRGLQDLTEVQKVFNSDHQQTHTYLRSVATPAMLVAADVLGEEGKARYLGTPATNIPIPMAALAEGVQLDQLARPAFQPQGVPAQFFEFTYNRLSEFAQFASHFLPFASGMPGVDNKTATGANITQAATNALYTPVLSVKGEVRKRIAEKLVKLYPQHFPIERFFPLGGKYGRHSGRMLKGADLNVDLVFEVVPDSWNPRNAYTKQQSYAAAAQVFGGMQGLYQAEQVDPERTQDIFRAFDLDLQSAPRRVAESVCFRRVRQMQKAAGLVPDPLMLVGVQYAQQLDPNTGQPVTTGQMVAVPGGAIQPPVSPAEPGHGIKRAWLMDWLDSGDGQEADPVLRDAVTVLIMYHTQLDGQQQALLAGQQGAVQLASQAPAMMAQQQAQAAQAEQQLGLQQTQMELEGQQQMAELGAQEAGLQLEAEREGLKQESAATQTALKMVDRADALAVRREQEAMRQ